MVRTTKQGSAGMIEVPVAELYSSFASGAYFNSIKDAKLMIILTKISEMLKPKSSNRQLVEKVMEYINENIMLQIDLDTLSEELSYNKDYLGRAFKKEMGMSINKFINSEKINMSKKLLDNSDMSISAIANALGWDDPNKFLKFFKYHENITPSQYREKKYSD
jgi:YesN/AraC family two-component response regulator